MASQKKMPIYREMIKDPAPAECGPILNILFPCIMEISQEKKRGRKVDISYIWRDY
jgi:hypothetical protein